MDYQDKSTGYIDPSGVSPQSTIVRYGVILGMAIIIYALIGMLTGMSSPANGFVSVMIFGLLTIVFYIVGQVLAVKQHRDKELGGSISFGRAFMVAFMVGLVAALLGSVFNYIYLNFIDPDYMNTVAEQVGEMMEGMGAPEEQIEKTIEQTKAGSTLGGLGKNLLWGAVVGAIVSAIIAAIMKKDHIQAA